jgi:manganese/iron transport system substrate-binding protein
VNAFRLSLRLDLTQIAIVTVILVVVAACSAPSGSTSGASPETDALNVVATTTVLADMVRKVGGTHVDVVSLVPPGGEVHTFDPTPADIARVADADLIVMNGLGLDEWLGDLARDSGASAPVVELAEDLEGVEYLAGDEDEHAGEASDHAGGAFNPHLWLNVGYAIKYAERIGEQLAVADPDHAADHEAGVAAYGGRLALLDTWAREQIAAIPEESRKIVSFHEAFPYFAAAYGLEVVGTVIEVPGQDPSAGEIAALIDAIRASGASAVFSEAQFNPQLAETIATEAGVDTYEGLIRWDVEKVVAALRS